jgi:hypothetical protein
MQRGDASADEIWQLENLKTIVLIYDLMMKRTIEKKGFVAGADRWPCPEATLEKVAARAAEDTNPQTVEEVYRTLKHALEKEHLAFKRDDQGVKWQWVDYLDQPMR